MHLRSVVLSVSLAAATAGFTDPAAAAQLRSPLTLSHDGGTIVHIFPPYETAKRLGLVPPHGAPPPVTGSFTYGFGHVMQPFVHYYVIY